MMLKENRKIFTQHNEKNQASNHDEDRPKLFTTYNDVWLHVGGGVDLYLQENHKDL